MVEYFYDGAVWMLTTEAASQPVTPFFVSRFCVEKQMVQGRSVLQSAWFSLRIWPWFEYVEPELQNVIVGHCLMLMSLAAQTFTMANGSMNGVYSCDTAYEVVDISGQHSSYIHYW